MTNRESSRSLFDSLRYHIIPPVFVAFFTFVVQLFPQLANGKDNTLDTIDFSKALGNAYSWKIVFCFFVWALLSLKVPSKKCYGPQTKFGYTPVYHDNGVVYYWASLVGFFILQATYPRLSVHLYENMAEILGTLNIVAFLLCIFLLIKGKLSPQTSEKLDNFPLVHEFYRGMELHPKFWGVDVKQLTNCRFGLMAWQLLIIAFFFAGVDHHGFNMGFLANLLLQSIYLAKFYWWEAGYFNTLDITLDRAGYYLCWGCLVWVPCFYTFTSYYLVAHPPLLRNVTAVAVFIAGVAFILLNYRVDYEKEQFIETKGNCALWGKPAKYIDVEYTITEGKKKSKLLVSGFWGITRHMNYTFEILAALMWCMPGIGYGVWPFLYLYFLIVLLVHRVFRDEEKCSSKYGPYWGQYCQVVKYRLIPYVF